MVAHGITSIEEGQLFLTPSLDRDWADPLVIPGMAVVADRVERAIRNHERIAVFGDFDVDGITSTCLLTEALRSFGANVTPFIPHRFDEGYGLSRAALDRVNELAQPNLIVTVDNGIAAKEEVSYLESLGIDLVVTDHHEPSDQVPQGVPLTDPKLEDEGPSRELAGAGVALKLVQVLGERLGKPSYWRSLIEVAALGTVSDMMPLTPENRALVAEGIQQMRVTARPGYIALAALAKADLSTITADGLSFSLIPRLNAAGRMADPKLALDLLLARDPIEASALAAELEEINRQRREIEAELTRDAMAKVEETYDGGRAIVVGGEGWHEGVKGIVASRLTNRYHVPALLFSIEDGIARGSGRSVGKVNLFDAVERCSDLLIRRGGHAGAVGVTIEASKLDEFRRRLSAVLSELPADDFEDTDEVAATVDLSELNIETIEQISRLEPFGQGNKVPLLAAEGVTMCDRAVVGKTGEHMRFVATDGAASVPAIMFRVPQIDKLINCDSAVDLVFEAVAEHWQGRVKPKLMIKDVLVRDTAAPNIDDPACELRRGVQPADSGLRLESRKRETLAQLSYTELTRSLIHSFIGSNQPHRAQVEALDALADHQSVLAVMGTGRGKSLIFHVHAAREAVLRGRASIFVYPLRALVADQAYHLSSTMAALGIGVGVLTGETVEAARDDVFAGLASGRTASFSRRRSSCLSIAIALHVLDVLALSLSMRHTMPVLPKAATGAPTSTCPIFSKPWATPLSWRQRLPRRPRSWRSLLVYCRLPGRWSTRPFARTCNSRTTVTLRAAKIAWCQSWRRGRRPSSTSTRATSPWRLPRRCANACPTARPILRSITPGLRAPIAAVSRKRFATEASVASFRPLPSVRASTCPISVMSCSTTCRLVRLSLTR